MFSPSRRLDLLGYGLAVIYALPTLLYPYGRDQALYAYVAWGWMDGFLPYVDSFDQKPPGIYLLYGITYLLFGIQTWAIRALELGALLWIGRTLARIAAGPEGPGGGIAALLVVGFHVTCFDYWHTGQLEIWEALFVCLAMEQALKSRPLVAGLLSGIAFVFKFPSLPMIVVVALATLAQRRQLSTFFLFLLGSILPAVVLFPWILAGKWDTLYEVLITYNRAYMDKEAVVLGTDRLWLRWALPFTVLYGVLFAGGIFVALKERKLEPGAWLIALAMAAAGSVFWQGKLYPYHWTVVPPFAAGAALWGAGLLLRGRPAGWGRGAALGIAILVVALGFLNAPGWFRNGKWTYRRYVPAAAQYSLGYMKRERFLSAFRSTHGGGFNAALLERVVDIVQRKKEPGDTLCERGFDPTINILTGTRCPSRFVADFALVDARLRYPMKKAWIIEHEKTLREQPPTMLVVTAKRPELKDNALKRGYKEVGKAGKYTVLRLE
ncbi:MAG TPA: glycosyltransferase 87 family protein [Myxococcota bacterium]|nr:glycosyltransferase 87 family protein [Myxococcota bacterium]